MVGANIVPKSDIAELQENIMEILILPNNRGNMIRTKSLTWFKILGGAIKSVALFFVFIENVKYFSYKMYLIMRLLVLGF